MINILQDIVNAVMGPDAFLVSELDPNVLMLSVIFMVVFSYMALRSLARFFFNLGNKF